MINSLEKIKVSVFNKFNFKVLAITPDKESQEYDGCEFVLDGKNIIFRSSKITPKKAGQFVFPKSVLIEKGILSTSKKDGKRGVRVYPI